MTVEAAAAPEAAPTTQAPPQEMPSIDQMTAHLQQARGGEPEADAVDPEGYEDPAAEEEVPDEGDAEGAEDPELEGDDGQDEPDRRAKPSQSDRLKVKLEARETELRSAQELTAKQQSTLEEIHGENLQFRAELEDMRFDYQEQSEYVKQLEAAVERLTDGQWSPDPREAEMREMRKQLRRHEREKQFQEQYQRQAQQRQAQLQRVAATKDFVGQIQDVARRFKVEPKRLARVVLAERAKGKDAMEAIARDLRGASPEALKAKRQSDKNRNAVRPLRPNGQVRSRAPTSSNPMADIENQMIEVMRARRGQG